MADDLIRKSDVLETYAELYDIFDDNKAIQEELHKVFDKINDIPTVEPNCSEKPNNCEVECEKCKHFREEADTYMKQCEYYFMECRFEPKTEPTISKMEQVEDETRLTAKCLNCANGSSYKCSKCDGEMYYKYDKDEPQTEMTTDQIVNELLSIKKILDAGKMPKQRCGNCKHLTYRWNKTWCDIKCDNPHDMVCDKWERSE